MGRNPKYSKETKVNACEDYETGKGSFDSIAKSVGCDCSTLIDWYNIYIEHGEAAFDFSSRNRKYSKEFKLSLINSYLLGEKSVLALSSEFNISRSVVRKWIKKYNECIDNGPIEGFFGTLKSEMFYRKKFESMNELIKAIEKYIYFYNNNRLQ